MLKIFSTTFSGQSSFHPNPWIFLWNKLKHKPNEWPLPHKPKKKTLHQSNNQTHHHTTNQLIKRVRESQRLGENNPPPLRGSLEQMSAWIWVKRMSFTITTNGTCLLVCPTLFRLPCLPLFSHSFKSNGGRSFFTHTTSISKCQLGKKNVIVNKKMICLVLVRNCNWKWNWKRVRESKHVTKD